MKLNQSSWFTLVELLISITIFILISVMAFAPYGFYMNKAKVKYTSKELSQIIYEAKNMATNGSAYLSWNVSVWVFIDNTSINKNSYSLLWFDHDVVESNIIPINGRLIQKYNLQPWIQIENFDWENKWIIFFRSITGSWLVVKGDSFNPVGTSEADNIINIEYSYKWSTNSSLRNSLEYFQDTQIVDY